MSTEVETENSGGGALDKVWWLVAIAALAGSVVFNNMYAEMSVLLRAGVFVVAVIVALFAGLQTDKGKTFMVFAKESKTEVRKVVWPNRQEALHTTMIIAAATAFMSLLLYLLDLFLSWGVGLLTGMEL